MDGAGREIGLGVIVVAYNSGGEAVDCAETLLAGARAAGVALRLVVVDNASSDDTAERLGAWASGAEPWPVPSDLPFAALPLPKPLAMAEGGPALGPEEAGEARVALIRSPVNTGFAGGVNIGLAHLARFPEIRHFWILNPDSVTPPSTLPALAGALETVGRYSLMGGRVTFYDRPDLIQIDGGLVNMRTGVTANLNLLRPHPETPPPEPAQMDFVMGANLIASREFYERIGPMREDYFLYYEEVDWAMRRGSLPLARCPGLVIHHRAGTAIGSPGIGRLATPFSLFFKHRGRMRFLRRFARGPRLVACLYTLAYAARLILRDRAPAHAAAVLRGAFGFAPPDGVRARLSPDAAARAFAPATE